MRKVNVRDLTEERWSSPKGTFGGAGLELSWALGRDPTSVDLRKRHPFDVELNRIEPGKKAWPYHSHSAQWEFYYVLEGEGTMRHAGGNARIVPGDAIIFEPGEAHQLINDGTTDLRLLIIADNPIGESCYYPDSGKFAVDSPASRLDAPDGVILRSQPLDYYDGEE